MDDQFDEQKSAQERALEYLAGLKDKALANIDESGRKLRDATDVQTARIREGLNPNMIGPAIPNETLPAEKEFNEGVIQAVAGSLSPVGKLPFHQRAALQKAEQQLAQKATRLSPAEANALDQGVQKAGDVAEKIGSRLKGSLREQAEARVQNIANPLPAATQAKVDSLEQVAQKFQDKALRDKAFAKIKELVRQSNIKGGNVK